MLFNRKAKRLEEIRDFVLAGGRPTWKEWKKWKEDEKEEAKKTIQMLEDYQRLITEFSFANSLEEKKAIADMIADYDGGELQRAVRERINQESMGAQS